MHQYLDERTLVVVGLIAINVGFFTLLFYRPKDMLPTSYDLLKWIAAFHLIAGILILSSLAAPLFFALLGITYFIAVKHCVKGIPDSSDCGNEAIFESVFFSIIAFTIWFIAKRSSPFGVLLVLVLGGYFSLRICSAYEQAQAVQDNERKQNLIKYLKSQCFYALSNFLFEAPQVIYQHVRINAIRFYALHFFRNFVTYSTDDPLP